MFNISLHIFIDKLMSIFKTIIYILQEKPCIFIAFVFIFLQATDQLPQNRPQTDMKDGVTLFQELMSKSPGMRKFAKLKCVP